MDSLNIRYARKEDMTALLRLYRELYQENKEQKDSEPMMEPDVAWEQVISDTRQHLLVAEAAGEIIGTATLIVIPNLGHQGQPWGAIENVIVGSGHRSSGVGESLMNAASKLAREHGCYKLMLSSNLLRKRAHDFYRRLGWAETHVGFSFYTYN